MFVRLFEKFDNYFVLNHRFTKKQPNQDNLKYQTLEFFVKKLLI